MMHWILSRTLLLSWALWVGGLVAVFLAVTTIFATLDPDRAQAGMIAANVFGRFEKLMILVGSLAVVSATVLMLGGPRGRRAFLVLLLAGLAGVLVSSVVIGPKINSMRLAKQTQTDEFKKLHGASMGVYVSITGLVALAGLFLPGVIRRDEPKKAVGT